MLTYGSFTVLIGIPTFTNHHDYSRQRKENISPYEGDNSFQVLADIKSTFKPMSNHFTVSVCFLNSTVVLVQNVNKMVKILWFSWKKTPRRAINEAFPRPYPFFYTKSLTISQWPKWDARNFLNQNQLLQSIPKVSKFQHQSSTTLISFMNKYIGDFRVERHKFFSHREL